MALCGVSALAERETTLKFVTAITFSLPYENSWKKYMFILVSNTLA
jgi:hypothetical protein